MMCTLNMTLYVCTNDTNEDMGAQECYTLALFLGMGMPVASQLVLYDNDAVEVSYSDGSSLQLSPCGAAFLFIPPPQDDQHPLFGDKWIQHRTQFVTSSYRPFVREALDFRNRFAEKCHACAEVAAGDVVKLPTDFLDIKWPASCSETNPRILEDGSVRLVSGDEFAVVTLAPSRQLFTMRFLCRTGQTVQRNRNAKCEQSHQKVNSTIDKNDSHLEISHTLSTIKFHDSTITNSDHKGEGKSSDEGLCTFYWVTQHFSVQVYPENWSHPCQLLLQVAKRNLNSVHFEDGDISEDNHMKCDPTVDLTSEGNMDFIYTPVSKSLPLNCLSPHLHKWTFSSTHEPSGGDLLYQSRLKVICSQGVIYRFIKTSSPGIEIYPGDGSVMHSSGLAGHYFTHHTYKAGKVEEKVHSVLHPPPDVPGSEYSIAKLLTRGARFLEHFCEESLHLLDSSSPCCWKVEQAGLPQKPLSPVLLEECMVAGVGRFTAHSSGRVRVVFCDRTCLDMTADFSHRLNQCKQHSEGVEQTIEMTSYQNQSVPATRSQDLPPGVCRLLLPNGHYQTVSCYDAGQYQKYIQAVQEWVQWVNCSPSERHSFYKDTVHDPEKLQDINREIKKIHCFNYIVENTVLPQFISTPNASESSINNFPNQEIMKIQSYLQQSTERKEYLNDQPSFPHTPIATGTHGVAIGTSSLATRPTESHGVARDTQVYCQATGASQMNFESGSRLNHKNSDAGEMSLQSVLEALKNTSQAIKELDNFLEKK